jgi:hypothetical protein
LNSSALNSYALNTLGITDLNPMLQNPALLLLLLQFHIAAGVIADVAVVDAAVEAL